jgi:hypothetical protein
VSFDARGGSGGGVLSDPTSRQALREFREEQRRSVLHRPMNGPTPRVIPGGDAYDAEAIGRERATRTVNLRIAATIAQNQSNGFGRVGWPSAKYT